MREIVCPKHERTRILHILSDSIPQAVRFTAVPVQGDGGPAGCIEVERSMLLIAGRKEEHQLQSENALRKGMFDTAYAVFVTPDEDTRIVFQSRHFTKRWLIWALAIALAAGVAAGLIPVIVRGAG